MVVGTGSRSQGLAPALQFNLMFFDDPNMMMWTVPVTVTVTLPN